MGFSKVTFLPRKKWYLLSTLTCEIIHEINSKINKRIKFMKLFLRCIPFFSLLMCISDAISSPRSKNAVQDFFKKCTEDNIDYNPITLNLFWTTGYQCAINVGHFVLHSAHHPVPKVLCGGSEYGSKIFPMLSLFLSCAPDFLQVHFYVDPFTLFSNHKDFKSLQALYKNFKVQDFSHWTSLIIKKTCELGFCSSAELSRIQRILQNGTHFSPVIASDVFRVLGVLQGSLNSVWAYCDIDTFCVWTEKLSNRSLHKHHIFWSWFKSSSQITKDTLINVDGTNDFLTWHIKNHHGFENMIKYYLHHLCDQSVLKEDSEGPRFEHEPLKDEFLTYYIDFYKLVDGAKGRGFLVHQEKFLKQYDALAEMRILRSNPKYMIQVTGPGKMNALIAKAEKHPQYFPTVISLPIQEESIVSARTWVGELTAQDILEDEFILDLPYQTRKNLKNIITALEDMRLIRNVLQWKTYLPKQDIKNWEHVYAWIKRYIEAFNIFRVETLMQHFIVRYEAQQSKICLISVEDGKRKHLPRKILTPKAFVEKIKRMLHEKGSMYTKIKDVFLREGVAFKEFDDIAFNRLNRELTALPTSSQTISTKPEEVVGEASAHSLSTSTRVIVIDQD